MYKQKAIDLSTLSAKEIKTWLQSFDTVMADCDGVLWNYDEPVIGSNLVMNEFKKQGKKIIFATNNSTKTRDEFVKRGLNLGYNIEKDDVLSTAYITANYLKNLNFKKKVYIVGSNGIGQEFDARGIKHVGIGPEPMKTNYGELSHIVAGSLDPEIGAVVVGLDEHISFPKLTRAVTYLNDPECLFISTNDDERLPMPRAVVPGAGCMVKAVEYVAERKPVNMGKPSEYFCRDYIKENGLVPERTLMIGDRCNTDIFMGTNCGFQTLLVGTGIHNMKNVAEYRLSKDAEEKKFIPDLYAAKLGDLLPYLQS